MYTVTVTIDGMTIAASKNCRTKREAENVKRKLSAALKDVADITITLTQAATERMTDEVLA